MNHYQHTTARTSGFTLIEVMITVAIIGIIVAVAYPNYQNYIVKTYRAKAHACMAEHGQFMERYYTTNMSYLGADTALAAAPLACRNDGNLNTRYAIVVGNLAQGSYTVTANPGGIQADLDKRCGSLTLDQSGTRTVSGTGTVADCW